MVQHHTVLSGNVPKWGGNTQYSQVALQKPFDFCAHVRKKTTPPPAPTSPTPAPRKHAGALRRSASLHPGLAGAGGPEGVAPKISAPKNFGSHRLGTARMCVCVCVCVCVFFLKVSLGLKAGIDFTAGLMFIGFCCFPLCGVQGRRGSVLLMSPLWFSSIDLTIPGIKGKKQMEAGFTRFVVRLYMP